MNTKIKIKTKKNKIIDNNNNLKRYTNAKKKSKPKS